MNMRLGAFLCASRCGAFVFIFIYSVFYSLAHVFDAHTMCCKESDHRSANRPRDNQIKAYAARSVGRVRCVCVEAFWYLKNCRQVDWAQVQHTIKRMERATTFQHEKFWLFSHFPLTHCLQALCTCLSGTFHNYVEILLFIKRCCSLRVHRINKSNLLTCQRMNKRKETASLDEWCGRSKANFTSVTERPIKSSQPINR